MQTFLEWLGKPKTTREKIASLREKDEELSRRLTCQFDELEDLLLEATKKEKKHG